MTNLGLTIADIMDLPIEQIGRFAEKLDEQRGKDIAAAKAKKSPTTT